MRNILFIALCIIFFFSCSENKHISPNYKHCKHITAELQYVIKTKLSKTNNDLTVVNELNKSTSDIFNEIEKIQQDLIKKSGGLDEYGYLINPDNKKIVELILVKQNRAQQLKQKSDLLYENLKKDGVKSNPVLKDAIDLSIDAKKRLISFEDYFFTDKNIREALITLEMHQQEFLLNQLKLIDQISE